MSESTLCVRPLPLNADEPVFDLLGLQQISSQRYPALLSSTSEKLLAQRQSPSSAPLQHNSRYDILMAFPEPQPLELRAADLVSGRAADFLQALDRQFERHGCAEVETELPFRGGWFVYLAYELAQQVEPSLQLPLGEDQVIAYAQRVRSAVVLDRDRNEAWWVCESDVPEVEQQRRWKQLERDCSELQSVEVLGGIELARLEEQDPIHYRAWVQKTLDYIRDGDVFQVNLSRPWRGQLAHTVATHQLFAELRQQNPSPFAACVYGPGFDVISSSPERLVSVRGGCVDTRPIAGTRPRLDRADDAAVTRELLGHPKERSEHIMLIDLERNDLGRICQPGSVEVNELMVLESYAHVHHIVSNVTGELRRGVSPGEVIRAVFPGGTITGCPKVRCMQILAELEAEPRGAYTGSLGYINRNGDMDLNILIRTIERRGEQLTFRAGGGIVADSEADRELDETRAKARGLLKMFQVRASN